MIKCDGGVWVGLLKGSFRVTQLLNSLIHVIKKSLYEHIKTGQLAYVFISSVLIRIYKDFIRAVYGIFLEVKYL